MSEKSNFCRSGLRTMPGLCLMGNLPLLRRGREVTKLGVVQPRDC